MKHLSKFSLMIFALLCILGFISTAGNTTATRITNNRPSRFYVVCVTGSHQWGGGYCAGGTDDLATANQMVADHNRQFEGHSADRCAGSCPPCN